MNKVMRAFEKPHRFKTLPEGIKYDIKKVVDEFNINVQVPVWLMPALDELV